MPLFDTTVYILMGLVGIVYIVLKCRLDVPSGYRSWRTTRITLKTQLPNYGTTDEEVKSIERVAVSV